MTTQTKTKGIDRAKIVRQIRRRDGDVCTHPDCGKPLDFDLKDDAMEPTIEHWIPQSWGKRNGWSHAEIWALDNLRLWHKRCNARKSDRLPNEDGTIPPSARESRGILGIRADKSNRKDVCETCESGRLLFHGEECPDCGSGPQPATFPRAYKKEPKECSHGWDDPRDHCWYCTLGFVERRPAMESVLDVDGMQG